MSKTSSIISALFCTFIWGTTFIAQETGMENIGPYVFNSVRFFVGFIALIPFYFFLEKKNTIKIISKNKKKFLILSFLIGIFLFFASVFQQVALVYTDVANAAFFTIFYVPMVPIIVFFLFKKKNSLECLAICFFVCYRRLFFNKFSRCNGKTWRHISDNLRFILESTYYFHRNNY